MTNPDTPTPRIAQRYACHRCRDKGWVMEPYYSDDQPTMREVVCPDCGHGRVPLTTRREVIELVIVLAVAIGIIVVGLQ